MGVKKIFMLGLNEQHVKSRFEFIDDPKKDVSYVFR